MVENHKSKFIVVLFLSVRMEEEQETKVGEVKRMIKRGYEKKKGDVREVIEKLEEIERRNEKEIGITSGSHSG